MHVNVVVVVESPCLGVYARCILTAGGTVDFRHNPPWRQQTEIGLQSDAFFNGFLLSEPGPVDSDRWTHGKITSGLLAPR